MLVLSRKKNESVIVAGNIRVVIVDVRGDKVQLGIEAPSDVSVFRSEVLEKIQNSERSEKSDEVVTLDMSPEGTSLRTEKKNKSRGASGSRSRARRNESESDRRRER